LGVGHKKVKEEERNQHFGRPQLLPKGFAELTGPGFRLPKAEFRDFRRAGLEYQGSHFVGGVPPS